MIPKKYFITAIGTDSGKTLISAIFAQALEADYWKPIQAGLPRDTETVKSLVSNPVSQFHPEKYILQNPLSPHAAAYMEGIEISLEAISAPITHNPLIIEGAGGILVPLNEQHFMIDIARKLAAEIVLVSNLYLGSINHTLLTVNELKRSGLVVRGIIFNGKENLESQNIILKYSRYPMLLHVHQEEEITPNVVSRYASQLRKVIVEPVLNN